MCEPCRGISGDSPLPWSSACSASHPFVHLHACPITHALQDLTCAWPGMPLTPLQLLFLQTADTLVAVYCSLASQSIPYRHSVDLESSVAGAGGQDHPKVDPLSQARVLLMAQAMKPSSRSHLQAAVPPTPRHLDSASLTASLLCPCQLGYHPAKPLLHWCTQMPA